MNATAQLNFLRMSPRKVKLVIDLVRGLRSDVALDRLTVLPQSAALPVAKLIRSAVANCKPVGEFKTTNVWIQQIMVGQGPSLKRFTPRAMGRATPIRRPTSHIQVVVGDTAPRKRKTLNSK